MLKWLNFQCCSPLVGLARKLVGSLIELAEQINLNSIYCLLNLNKITSCSDFLFI